MASRGGEKAPAFDGRGAHFLDYGHQVHLRMRTTRAEISARSSFLISHMQPAPRQVCLAEDSDILDHGGGVSKISDVLRNYFALEAGEAIHQQVMQSTRVRRAAQATGEYIAEFARLRRKAGSKMAMAAGFAETTRRYCVWTTRPYLARRSP